jgi:hypothetical protein
MSLMLAACSGGAPSDQAPADSATEPAAPAGPQRPDSAGTAGDSLPGDSPVGTVCPDPRRPCPGFREHDLSFVLPTDAVARAEAESEEFFAVLLRSGGECSISEEQRSAAQADFPEHKVFAHRFGCDGDVENNVTYSGANPEMAFLGVFAGRTRPAADSMLAEIRQAARYTDANIRRMRVRFVHP